MDMRIGPEPIAIEPRDGLALTIHTSHAQVIQADAMFLFIGAEPFTDWLDCTRDPHGFIVCGPSAGLVEPHATTIPGVFAIGDVRAGSTKRIAFSAGDGAAVLPEIRRYLVALQGG